MTTDFYITKGRDGWEARTEIQIGTDPEKDLPRFLSISTCKGNGSIDTTASCFVKDGIFRTFKVYWDFFKVVERSGLRCTEKAVRLQHQRHLEQLEQYKAMAEAHYVPKDIETLAQKAKREAAAPT